MSAPLLSELREPPVVGRYYMVPVVRHPWHGRTDDWPVFGPMHTDREFFGFDAAHYHVDMRFIGKRHTAWAIRQLWYRNRSGDEDKDLALVCSVYPLADRLTALPTGRPGLARRRCVRSHVGTPLLQHMKADMRENFRAHYGDTPEHPAAAIRKADGRRLCPHRKVDLSSLSPDANGVVVCPLHGLRVCIS